MANDSVDLEQECEDALFELSDARERYPAKCANLYSQCLQYESMQIINQNKPDKLPKVKITSVQKELLSQDLELNDKTDDSYKWKKLTDQIQNLQTVLDQIKTDKLHPLQV